MNLHLYKTKCQNVALFLVCSTLFHLFVGAVSTQYPANSEVRFNVSQNVFKGEVFYHLVFLEIEVIHQRKHNCHRSQLTNLQNSVPVKTPIKCDLNLTKKELHKLTFDRLANIFTHSDIFFHSVNIFPTTEYFSTSL